MLDIQYDGSRCEAPKLLAFFENASAVGLKWLCEEHVIAPSGHIVFILTVRAEKDPDATVKYRTSDRGAFVDAGGPPFANAPMPCPPAIDAIAERTKESAARQG